VSRRPSAPLGRSISTSCWSRPVAVGRFGPSADRPWRAGTGRPPTSRVCRALRAGCGALCLHHFRCGARRGDFPRPALAPGRAKPDETFHPRNTNPGGWLDSAPLPPAPGAVRGRSPTGVARRRCPCGCDVPPVTGPPAASGGAFPVPGDNPANCSTGGRARAAWGAEAGPVYSMRKTRAIPLAYQPRPTVSLLRTSSLSQRSGLLSRTCFIIESFNQRTRCE